MGHISSELQFSLQNMRKDYMDVTNTDYDI